MRTFLLSSTLNDLPPYPADHNMRRRVTNHWLTKSLFYDMMLNVYSENRPEYRPKFTLNDHVPGYICCRTTFVELMDPSGYQWAMKYLGDYNHWKELCRCSWFAEALAGWQEELAISLKSEALKRIVEIAGSDGPQSLPAARWLAEEGWLPKRGRPSKAEVAGELKRAVQALTIEEEDAERIGLKVINGGKT